MTSTGRHWRDAADDDGSSGMAYLGRDGTNAFAVTTEQSAWLYSTGVGTDMGISTRAQDYDEETTFGTERDGIWSLSENDSSDIVRSGPRAEEPFGEPASYKMLSRKVDAVATESRDQGRVRTQIVWGQGIPL